jgi:organic hydroperoxide reductase OsmC/OhrA
MPFMDGAASMAEYHATVSWARQGAVFTDNRYARAHAWSFDGGAVVPASSSPHEVPVPLSNPAHVDPEEAFVAAIASCHMLFFLNLAAKRGFVIDSYDDDAVGVMEKGVDGKMWMAKARLRPRIVFSGARLPTPADIDALHHDSHAQCYIANSVKTEIVVEKI